MEQFNTPKDLLSPAMHSLYIRGDHQQKVRLVYDALTTKLKEDPDYELWVPVSYYAVKGTGKDLITSEDTLISSKARLFSVNRNRFKHSSLSIKGNQVTFSMPAGVNSRSFTLSRAVASSFVPAPAGDLTLLSAARADMTVSDYGFVNIRWLTRKAVSNTVTEQGLWNTETGENHYNTLFIHIRVDDYHGYAGQEYYIGGRVAAVNAGFSMLKNIEGDGSIKTKGCTIKYITRKAAEQLTHWENAPAGLLERFNSAGGYFHPELHVINLKTLKTYWVKDDEDLSALGLCRGDINQLSHVDTCKSTKGYAAVRRTPNQSDESLQLALRNAAIDAYVNGRKDYTPWELLNIKTGEKQIVIGTRGLLDAGIDDPGYFRRRYREGVRRFKNYIVTKLPFNLEHIKLM